jgi:hypothetical protein
LNFAQEAKKFEKEAGSLPKVSGRKEYLSSQEYLTHLPEKEAGSLPKVSGRKEYLSSQEYLTHLPEKEAGSLPKVSGRKEYLSSQEYLTHLPVSGMSHIFLTSQIYCLLELDAV